MKEASSKSHVPNHTKNLTTAFLYATAYRNIVNIYLFNSTGNTSTDKIQVTGVHKKNQIKQTMISSF